MEKNKNVKETCTPCEANFQKNVNKMVDNVEGHSQEKHNKKQEELDEAFEKTTRRDSDCGCGM